MFILNESVFIKKQRPHNESLDAENEIQTQRVKKKSVVFAFPDISLEVCVEKYTTIRSELQYI